VNATLGKYSLSLLGIGTTSANLRRAERWLAHQSPAKKAKKTARHAGGS
jgi:hypothetical protein